MLLDSLTLTVWLCALQVKKLQALQVWASAQCAWAMSVLRGVPPPTVAQLVRWGLQALRESPKVQNIDNIHQVRTSWHQE